MTAKKTDQVEVFMIKSRGEKFRRCNTGFTSEGAYYEKRLFTEEQQKTLKNEPNLMVTETTIGRAELDGPFEAVQ